MDILDWTEKGEADSPLNGLVIRAEVAPEFVYLEVSTYIHIHIYMCVRVRTHTYFCWAVEAKIGRT